MFSIFAPFVEFKAANLTLFLSLPTKHLFRMLKSHLDQLLSLKQLVENTTCDQYTKSIDVLPHSTIGRHVRHILEFFDCFIQGTKNDEIDYIKRKRDLSIEEFPVKACQKCDELIANLSKISSEDLNKPVMVWSEMQDTSEKLVSSMARELEYLFHHMVHHLALISVYFRSQGLELDENFGVAPSTVSYWKENKSTCAP